MEPQKTNPSKAAEQQMLHDAKMMLKVYDRFLELCDNLEQILSEVDTESLPRSVKREGHKITTLNKK